MKYGIKAALQRAKKVEHSGFILWELIVVLFLMGVILILCTPHFSSASNHLRMQMNRANIQSIEGSAQLYRIDVGTYPLSVTDLLESPMGSTRWQGPYLKEIPINPFNSEQGYELDSSGLVKNS
ncbi:type II secretion system protein GspG [Desulfosporosinus sp.]|uniref:type II secretion system protein GspG n=1 Tax=Desulfosporosinus sp. TaxID=157907 RepID=UPI0025BA26EF|nr:type II secretion system protein GspG [Desulfosporosinus sp.]